MTKYELMFILEKDLTEEKREATIVKFKDYVLKTGGNVVSVDKWGMKKLAYPINFKNEGFYVLMNLEMNGTEVDKMAKLMNITDGVIRQMFVKK